MDALLDLQDLVMVVHRLLGPVKSVGARLGAGRARAVTRAHLVPLAAVGQLELAVRGAVACSIQPKWPHLRVQHATELRIVGHAIGVQSERIANGTGAKDQVVKLALSGLAAVAHAEIVQDHREMVQAGVRTGQVDEVVNLACLS